MIYGWLISGISASNWFDLIQYNTLANINKKKKRNPKNFKLHVRWVVMHEHRIKTLKGLIHPKEKTKQSLSVYFHTDGKSGEVS